MAGDAQAGPSLRQHSESKTKMEWSVLPGEVTQLILLKLPLPDLFRLRVVSRSWNTLLSSNAFLQLWSSAASTFHSYWLKEGVPPAALDPAASRAISASDVCLQSTYHFRRTCCRRPVQHPLSLLCLCARTRKDYSMPLPKERFLSRRLPEALDTALHGAVSRCVPCKSTFAAGGGSLVAELAFYCGTHLFRCESYSPSPMAKGADELSLRLFLATPKPAVRVLNVVTGCSRQLPLPLRPICMEAPSSSILLPGLRDRDRRSPYCLLERRTIRDRSTAPYVLHLLVSDDSKYYHLVIQVPSSAVILLVYDSRCQCSWKVVHGMRLHPVRPRDESVWELSQAAFQGHDIYEGDLFFPMVSKSSLFAYRVETDDWSKIALTRGFPPECDWHKPTVMKFKGPKVLMAVPLSSRNVLSRRCSLDGFCVWELQKCSLHCSESGSQRESYSWTEVARTPETLSSEYDFVDALHFVHNSNLICMTGTYRNKGDCSNSGGDDSNDVDWQEGCPTFPKRCVSPPVYDIVHDCWFLMPFDWMNSRAEPLILSSIEPSFPGAVP